MFMVSGVGWGSPSPLSTEGHVRQTLFPKPKDWGWGGGRNYSLSALLLVSLWGTLHHSVSALLLVSVWLTLHPVSLHCFLFLSRRTLHPKCLCTPSCLSLGGRRRTHSVSALLLVLLGWPKSTSGLGHSHFPCFSFRLTEDLPAPPLSLFSRAMPMQLIIWDSAMFVGRSVCLSVCLSQCLCVCLSISLSVLLSACLFICPSLSV